jgi:lipopolysaccharide export system protein LptC
MSRRLWLAIAVLAVAAGLTQLAVWWLTPPPPPSTFAGPPRSSYTLHDFKLTTLGIDGKPTLFLTAPQLDRRNGDHALYINAPHFVLPQANGAAWRGAARFGWVNAQGTEIKLLGDVRVVQPASAGSGQNVITSQNITAWPRKHLLTSTARTVIQQPNATLSGVGFRANTATRTLELLDDVHGTLQPAARHAP